MLFPVAVARVPQNGRSLLDRASLDQALTVAAQSSAERQRFHARYMFPAPAPIESVEIVTPFRRAVIEARRRAAATGQLPRLHELREVLRTHPAGVVVLAVVRLDPRHTYMRPPAHSIRILAHHATLDPVTIRRWALGPRRVRIPSEAVGGSVSVTAVEIDARFRSNPFADPGGCRVAVIDPRGRTLGSVTIGAGFR